MKGFARVSIYVLVAVSIAAATRWVASTSAADARQSAVTKSIKLVEEIGELRDDVAGLDPRILSGNCGPEEAALAAALQALDDAEDDVALAAVALEECEGGSSGP